MTATGGRGQVFGLHEHDLFHAHRAKNVIFCRVQSRRRYRHQARLDDELGNPVSRLVGVHEPRFSGEQGMQGQTAGVLVAGHFAEHDKDAAPVVAVDDAHAPALSRPVKKRRERA